MVTHQALVLEHQLPVHPQQALALEVHLQAQLQVLALDQLSQLHLPQVLDSVQLQHQLHPPLVLGYPNQVHQHLALGQHKQALHHHLVLEQGKPPLLSISLQLLLEPESLEEAVCPPSIFASMHRFIL